jgi:hypothetical protein
VPPVPAFVVLGAFEPELGFTAAIVYHFPHLSVTLPFT